MPDSPRGALKAAAEALGGDEDAARRVLAAVVPLVERSAVKRAAERIILLGALASGARCPACHGKPATTPSIPDRRAGYTCGCGHAWDPPGPRDRDYGTEPRYILARLARGIPLPDLPPKTKKESGG